MAAQLTLAQLLKFRNRNSEAYDHIAQAVNKHWDASEARKDMMVCLQDIDPASASHQAFIINCLQNGSISKIPTNERPEKPKKLIQPPTTEASAISNDVKPAAFPRPTVSAANKVIDKKNEKHTEASKPVKKEISKPKNKLPRVHKTHETGLGSSLLVPPPPLPSWFGFGDQSRPPQTQRAPPPQKLA